MGNIAIEALVQTARRWGRRFASWWWTPMPEARLGRVRALVGLFAWVYFVVRLMDFVRLAVGDMHIARFAPIGIWSWLEQPIPALWLAILIAWTLVTGPLFCLGIRWRVAGPGFALGFLALTSYRSAWGMIFHTENLIAIHLVVLALSRPARICPQHGEESSTLWSPDWGWPIRLLCLTTVITYALAGWAKITRTGWTWLSGDVLMQQIAYDNLRKIALGDMYSPIGAQMIRWTADYPQLASTMFAIAAGVALTLEIAAPLALLGRRLAIGWIAGIWAFHCAVLATMAILFPYPVSGVAFVSFIAPEKWRAFNRICAKVGPRLARTSRKGRTV